MSLGSNSIQWCEATKYRDVYLQGGRSLKFDINPTKRAFYAACNSILYTALALMNLQCCIYRKNIAYQYLCMPSLH